MSPFWMGELLAAGSVAGAMAVVLLAVEALRRARRLSSEASRKAVHLGTGLLVCVFPWIFRSAATVGVLSVGFLGLLLFLRSRKLLSAVGDVERQSVGELLFPVSVGLLFWAAQGQPAFYLASMLVLVVPDAVAALVGKSYGRHLFDVEQGEHKSLEGSLMFFLLTFLAVLLPLLLMTDLPKGPLVLVALQLAYLAACLEAISVGGMDNLIIPLASYYILIQTTKSDGWWISAQLGIQTLLVGVTLLLAWRGRILSVSGVLAAQLYLYGVFAYGGYHWLLAPLLVYAAFAFYRRPGAAKLSHPGFKAVSFFWAVSAPLSLLVLNNYLVVFEQGPLRDSFGPLLAGLFGASHGAGLACVGQIYRPNFGRGLLKSANKLAWPATGAAVAMLLAYLLWLAQDTLSLEGLVLGAFVGAGAPLLQQAVGSHREGVEASGARQMAFSLLLVLVLALGVHWLLRS